MATDSKRCTATRRDGAQCSAQSLPGEPMCFAHSPAMAEARTAARRRGGSNSAKVVRLRGLVPPRLLPVFDRLERALADVLSGDLDPKQAQAAASVARAMVSVLSSGELEERLRRLEGIADGNT